MTPSLGSITLLDGSHNSGILFTQWITNLLHRRLNRNHSGVIITTAHFSTPGDTYQLRPLLIVFWAGSLPKITLGALLPDSSGLRQAPGSRVVLVGNRGPGSWAQAKKNETQPKSTALHKNLTQNDEYNTLPWM